MRKVVSTIVLVGALLIAGRLFGVLGGGGPVPLEIHYLLGDRPRCVALEVVATPVGKAEAAARFETQLISPDVKQTTRLPSGEERLDITLVFEDPKARKTVTRTIIAERDARVRIDLSREAAP